MKWSQAAVVLVTAVHFANTLPTNLSFSRFAFGDNGWPLTTQAMWGEGDWPVRDFGYFYGLLTLVVNHAWFAVFGRTPEAVVALYGVCGLATAIGVVRVMAAVNLRGLAAAYLVAVAVFVVMPRGFPSPAHALEAALLTHALACHAAGRPGRALTLVTVAVFVKPSLGYVYGLILLALVVSGWPGGQSRWRRLIPAAATGTFLTAVLAAGFGWQAVLDTQVPLTGMRAYRDAGFGFFNGSGKLFWQPALVEVGYYVYSVVGVWLASSVVLVACAIRLLPRAREPAANVVLTCAALHLVFVFWLFGNQFSWIYYPFLLFVGTAVGLGEWRAWPVRAVAVALTVLALAGQYYWVWRGELKTWSRMERRPETAGLYATRAEAEAWAELCELAKAHRVFVLTRMGCPHLLVPEGVTVGAPRSWCLIQSTATKDEMDHVLKGIAAAEYVVSVNWHDNDLMKWESLKEVLEPFKQTPPERQTPLYVLYRRHAVRP
jgi:hypothetical protein